MSLQVNVFDMKGATLRAINGMEKGSDSITFEAEDGRVWKMYHCQDCCELVEIDDVVGEPEDLIGEPLLIAEEVSNLDDLPPRPNANDSYTWTFYKFATIKGYVTVKWYGESNGWYSERVDFARVA